MLPGIPAADCVFRFSCGDKPRISGPVGRILQLDKPGYAHLYWNRIIQRL